METTPLENLLIEHPSMSVYHSPTVSSVLPKSKALASIASNSESFDDNTPVVFEALKCKERLPKHLKRKALRKSQKSVPLDEFKIAPESILGDVPSVSSSTSVEVKKIERSPAEMFPVLAPISKAKVFIPTAVRSYKEVAASLKRRQPKNEVPERKHVKIESETEVTDSPKTVLPLEDTQTAVKTSVPKRVMKKGSKPPCPLPHLMKNELQKMPKETIVPKMRAPERLVKLSSFSVIQSDVPKTKRCKTPKRKVVKTIEKPQTPDSTNCAPIPKPVVVLNSEEKKKKKVQQKSVVKETITEKIESHPVTTQSSTTPVVKPKCDVIEKRDQKSPMKKENIIIPLTTSIALNSLVSRPEENAYKHEMLKRELAMIAGNNKAQKVSR